MSSTKSVSTDNKPLESIEAYAEELNKRRDAQAERYKQAKLQTNVWTDAKNAAHRKFMSVRANSNGKKTSELSFALAKYNTVCTSYRDAEINEDICRGSYTDSIYTAGNANLNAIVAEHLIG